ncbi:homoserine dehydrogenase [Elioraea sp.]|uniref:homoserine dehydrogenase n=1 Tax=Elioraea sp. TaxID=2185103 RepID=UPI0025C27167|nr:homoserine dehydrogenase [Elioraea sp.]
MQFETLFRAAADRPVRAALLGAGEFGLSLIAQALRMRGLRITAALDRDPARVAATLAAAGIAHRRCASAAEARAAEAAGELALCERLDDLLTLPLDIVVEATGDAEAATVHSLAALAAGIGVAMVSKEAECVVGPALAAKARKAGLPWTLVDGDQPSLLIGLVSWARTLGLPIVAAGKSSEYDFVFDPATGRASWLEHSVAAPEMAGLWHLPEGGIPACLAGRATALAALPQRTVPDACEMALVANATGLMPDTETFHAPLARTIELPDIYATRAAGGVLGAEGALDVFNCLRRPDEASFAGGVFVVVSLADRKTGDLFAGKGIPVSRDRSRALIYNPSHLLGVEAPISVMAAARLAHPMVDEQYHQRIDLVARAETALPAGRVLAIEGTRHVVPGLGAGLMPARPVGSGAPVPYYMAVGRRLARPVAAGALVTCEDIEPPAASALWTLRQEADAAITAR